MRFFKKSFLLFCLLSILFKLNSQEYNLNSPIDLPLNLSGTLVNLEVHIFITV